MLGRAYANITDFITDAVRHGAEELSKSWTVLNVVKSGAVLLVSLRRHPRSLSGYAFSRPALERCLCDEKSSKIVLRINYIKFRSAPIYF